MRHSSSNPPPFSKRSIRHGLLVYSLKIEHICLSRLTNTTKGRLYCIEPIFRLSFPNYRVLNVERLFSKAQIDCAIDWGWLPFCMPNMVFQSEFGKLLDKNKTTRKK